MRTTAITIVTILAAIGLLVGAVLLTIAAKIAAAAVLFLLFAAVAVWAIVRRIQGPAQPPGPS
jgi:membrane protein implicated in regulation of membrane protease activity